MQHVRVVLIDRQSLFRAGLKLVLDKYPGLEVVGDADDLKTGRAVIETRRPDVALIELLPPGEATFAAVDRIQESNSELKVIFLSDGVSEWPVVQALRIGAKGYLSKTESSDFLHQAIREVASGGIAFSEPIGSRLAPGRQGFELGDGLAPSLLSLSRRELEVLRRLACGEAVRGIAGELNRSIRTINNHRTNLMKKLGIHNRVALARFAVESGLVGLEMRFPRGVGRTRSKKSTAAR